MADLLRRFWRGLLAWTVGLLIVFEEWGWAPLQRLLERVAHLPVLRQIERGIARLPPYGALALYAVPALSLLPVKLGALWLIGQGHAVLGVAVIVAAKVIGTAIVARLFVLTQPALMKLAWFARLYHRFTAWKAALLLQVRASWPWRASRVFKRLALRRWQHWRG